MLSSMLHGKQEDFSHHQNSTWGGRPTESHGEGASRHPSSAFTQSSQYRHTSQRLPSPPDSMEEIRDSKPPSLPGFQNLLSDLQQKDEEQERHHKDISSMRTPSESHQYGTGLPYGSSHRPSLPPTPPMRPGSGFAAERQISPPLSSSFSNNISHSNYASGYSNGYHASAMNNLDPHNQRQPVYPPITTEKRPSVTSQGYSPYSSSLHGSPASGGSYQTSPIEAPPSSALLYQRPLPTTYAPTFPAPHQMMQSYGAMSSWQAQAHHHHHHHYSPSSIPPYSQSPDRYLCTQCSKAFSRPSSLKIHMHSHTGEKPFKCGHAGCGKAFSVRSNMKRHEKGCHGDAPGPGQFISVPNQGPM